MTSMTQLRKPRSWAMFSVIAVTVVLPGCSDEIGGTPLPMPTNSISSGPTASSSTTEGVFGNLDACEVLDKALNGQSFPSAVVDKAGGDNGCDTSKSRVASVALSLQPDLGIQDTNADPAKIHVGKINNRPAVQIREPLGSTGGCGIMIEVTGNSRAHVTAAFNGTTDEACAFATEVAKKVEPQLPKGN
jgi:hypothetical protein